MIIGSTSPKPTVLIMTSTPIENEDVASSIQIIKAQNLKVDVVTFSSVQSPTLLKLVHNGNLYAGKCNGIQIPN